MGGNIDLIFKIAGVGILVAVLHTILKHAGKEEQGHLVALAGIAIVDEVGERVHAGRAGLARQTDNGHRLRADKIFDRIGA